MRKDAHDRQKRDGKVDLMKSMNFAEKMQRETEMSQLNSYQLNRREGSEFDDEEELGMSIANFSKSYCHSSLADPHYENHSAFEPNAVMKFNNNSLTLG